MIDRLIGQLIECNLIQLLRIRKKCFIPERLGIIILVSKPQKIIENFTKADRQPFAFQMLQ